MVNIKNNARKGFTLIELLVVIGILAILVLAVIFFVNPAQLESQGRDSNRISDLNTLDQDVALYHETVPAGSLGSSSVVYISIPDPAATTTAGDQCQGLSLRPLSGGWVYQCAASSTYLKADGTGWLPINFSLVGKNLISKLPVDPLNTTTSCDFYSYTTSGKNYEITGRMESQKNVPVTTNDGGQYADLYEAGSSLSLLNTDVGGGLIWSVSTSQNALQTFSGCSGQYLSQITGNGPSTLSAPYGVAIASDGNIYVLNFNNSYVDIFNAAGNFISQFGAAGSGNGQFTNTYGGIAINPLTDNVYIADAGADRVEIFNASGTYLSQFGTLGTGSAQLDGPDGIAINPLNGNVDVADYYNERVQVWNASGTYLWQIGESGNGYASGTLGNAIGVATDPVGDVYVTSACPVNRVDEFSATGTFLSRFGSGGTGDGEFGCPHGIAIGPDGKIYVADKGNNRVEIFDSQENYLFQFPQTNPTFLTVQ